jgi:hypothetical protein
VAGVSVLAAATAAVAITAGGGGTDNRLSLVSGGTVSDAESARSAAPAGEPAPMANGDAGDAVMSSDAKMSIAPWYQTTYEIDGDLSELGGEGRAWRFVAPDFDGKDAARMAAAFGLSGTPTERDGGWILETADGHFSAFPSTDSWSINFNRSTAPTAGDSGISAADAEAAARALLDDLGVLEGRWDTEAMATEVGAAYGCAMPAMPAMPADAAASDADLSPEELKTRESGVARGEPGIDPNLCPPAPPPVAAQHVALYPVLDGLRPDWSAWGVTVAAGGEIHSVYGTWTELREAGSYKLRSVDAALDELRNPVNYAGEGVRPMPAIASDDMATSSVAPDAPVSAGATPAVDPGAGTSGSEPAVAIDMPAPDYCDPAADCGVSMVPVEQKVTITGVSRSLTLTSVWTDGTVQTHLVPAYRFTGKWSSPEMGDRWETTVIALHPDAIAPPPPVGNVVPDAETKVRTEG